MESVYLDNAATTFPKPEEVYVAMDIANREYAVNAGRGSYALARKATEIIDSTKKLIRELVKADPTVDVIFTASITIAINQILNGIDFKPGDVVFVSPYEHNAVARTIHKLEMEKGILVKQIPLDSNCEIDIDRYKDQVVIDKPRCICCTHVSNVTGYVLPVDEIFNIAKTVGAITLLDTAQSLGVLAPPSENVDYMAFAGHKTLYGPLGIGGFIDFVGKPLEPYFTGGTGSNSLDLNMPETGEAHYEASSPNIVAIAGLNAALKNIDSSYYEKEKEITTYAIERLQELDNVVLYIPRDVRKHTSIISFNVEDYMASEIGQILDEESISGTSIAVRTGYHCAPYIHDYLGDKRYAGTVRIGIGRYNTKKDIDKLIDAIEAL